MTFNFSDPLWYLNIGPIWEEISKDEQKKNDFWVEGTKKLVAGEIALGNEIGVWDTDRKPIDTITIHHTGGKPGMTLDQLSVLELFRLYAPYYAQNIKTKPISSGHVRNNRQVFWPYHWIVRANGKYKRLLEDNEVGWQAGNWEINCKSIAIVFDNDLENGTPSDIELASAREIIAKYPNCKILGHREVNPKTICPSSLFLGENGWKNKLW